MHWGFPCRRHIQKLLGASVEGQHPLGRLVVEKIKQVVPVLYVGVPVCGASVVQGMVMALCQQARKADSGGQNHISQAHLLLYIVKREQCAEEGQRVRRRRITTCAL